MRVRSTRSVDNHSAIGLAIALSGLMVLVASCGGTGGDSGIWPFGGQETNDDNSSGRCFQIEGSPADRNGETSCDIQRLTQTPPATTTACGEKLYGRREQFQKTPREITNLELLALEQTNSLIAPECVYNRIQRDIPTIRMQFRESRHRWFKNDKIRYAPVQNGDSFVLAVDSDTAEQIRNGRYRAWNCLNGQYEKSGHTVADEPASTAQGIWRVKISFEGTYDMRLVAKSYVQLPGVVEHLGERVHGVDSWADNPEQRDAPFNICLEVKQDAYHYVVVDGWGDCPNGCLKHHLRYFTSTAEGEICLRDTYRIESSEDEKSAPSWVEICDWK